MAPVAKRARVDDTDEQPADTTIPYGVYGGVYGGDWCRRPTPSPVYAGRNYPPRSPPPPSVPRPPVLSTAPVPPSSAAEAEEEDGGPPEPLLPLTDPAAWRPILEDGFAAGHTLPRMWADTVAPLVGVPFPYADGGGGDRASSSPLDLRARGDVARRLRAFGDALWSTVGGDGGRRSLPVSEPETWAHWRRLIDDIRTCTPVVVPVVVGCIEAALLCHSSSRRRIPA
jgi:hypothetical protein